MKIERIIMAACAAAALGLAGCKHDDPNEVRFDNKVFIDRTELSADLPVKPTTQSYTRTLSVATAKPVDGELTVRFEADASKVERSAKPITPKPSCCPRNSTPSSRPRRRFRPGA